MIIKKKIKKKLKKKPKKFSTTQKQLVFRNVPILLKKKKMILQAKRAIFKSIFDMNSIFLKKKGLFLNFFTKIFKFFCKNQFLTSRPRDSNILITN